MLDDERHDGEVDPLCAKADIDPSNRSSTSPLVNIDKRELPLAVRESSLAHLPDRRREDHHRASGGVPVRVVRPCQHKVIGFGLSQAGVFKMNFHQVG